MNMAASIAFYGIIIVGMAILFGYLTERSRKRREVLAYERLKREHPERVFGTKEYLARFDHPDFAAIEAHINRPLPGELKALYKDSASLRNQDLIVIPRNSTRLAGTKLNLHFFPADAHAIADLWPFEDLDDQQIPFATDGSGHVYYVELRMEDETDPPVYVYQYDDGLRYKVAQSVSEFRSWPRILSDESDRVGVENSK